MSGIVIVVGSVNVDEIYSVAALPAPGETVIGAAYQRAGGGKGANMAVSAATSGAPTYLVGAVGVDASGAEALSELQTFGVDTTEVVRLDEPTGRAAVITGPTENLIAVASGANAALDPEHVTQAVRRIAQAAKGVCLISGEIEDEVISAAAVAAHQAGFDVLYNAAPAKPLGGPLAAVDPTVIVNEVEATQLSGVGDPSEAASFLANLYGSAVVTRGGDGVSWVNDHQHTSSPAIPIRVLDTTGAGDAFCGAFAAARAAGDDFGVAIQRGTVAGGSAASSAGARGWAK